LRMLEAVSLADVAAGVIPVEGTMPVAAGCPAAPPGPEAEPADEEAEPPAAEALGAETDLAVSTVLLDPMVECPRGIFAAFGGGLGVKTAPVFIPPLEVAGVAGAAVDGADTIAL